jgi:excinuclease ABC subunit C
MLLLQRIRDESHRFAIEFQRELRSKVNMTSILEELPGIGPGKRRALLKGLGSLRAVRNASLESLSAVPGISARDAEQIRRFFDALAVPDPGAAMSLEEAKDAGDEGPIGEADPSAAEDGIEASREQAPE